MADSPVKLRREFKRKLEFIANHYRVAMYTLVEQQMKDFIDREFKKLLQEELKKIEADE